MKNTYFVTFALLTLLLVPAISFAQEQPAERGSIEFGVRHIWGDVYGRPDLAFKPDLLNSKFNEYSDIRNGFFVRNFNAGLDNVLGSNNFVSVQSRSAVYKDQSLFASFGKYGRYKVQFRYDQSPHTYTNTGRMLFTETTPGVFAFPSALRTTLQAFQGPTANNVIPAVNALVPSFNFVTPSTTRKAGTANFLWNATENWNVSFLFSRENQTGSRPIAYVLNSSPSASASAGYGVELPEPIDYNTNTIKAGTEYGRKLWGVQFGYTGSLFENNISKVVFDNPFNAVDSAGKPSTGQAALYPGNSAHNLTFAGALDPNKYFHLAASITPGWRRQNDAFLPYTSSAAMLAQTSALPAPSLNGERQTLAMNYTFTSRPVKSVEIAAKYRQYDYNNNTPALTFTPVQGDVSAPGAVETTPYAFFKKNAEVAGTWFFTKKSSAKVGYEWEGWDREHRDVNHTGENSVFASVDLVPHKTVQFRVSYRHADRNPDVYANDSEELMPALRRFDENARIRDRADASLAYSPIDALTFTASWGTTQDNYNLPANSLNGAAYGFLAGSALPYYSYGLLKDIGTNYGFGVDWAATKQFSIFGEYTREKYRNNMVSRQRNVNTVNGAEAFDTASDTPGNDWTSFNRDLIDTYATGVDLYLSKKVYITAYYSLSAGTGLNHTTALGNAAMYGPGGIYYVPKNGAIPASKFLVTTVLDFPETTTRLHEVGAVFKFKLTKNLVPKFEYRLQQYDSNDFQTSPMNPYMGISNPGAVNFYPYINVFDASAARFLFLGADQPSYRAHTATASLEYHF